MAATLVRLYQTWPLLTRVSSQQITPTANGRVSDREVFLVDHDVLIARAEALLTSHQALLTSPEALLKEASVVFNVEGLIAGALELTNELDHAALCDFKERHLS